MLGDAESGRWVEFVDDAKDLLWHESMPQPTSFKMFRIDALSTRHGIPSCAWQISRKERRGSFNRHKASLAGLGNEEKKKLSEGFDIELEGGEVLRASSFRGPSRPSTSIVLSGDTAEQSIEPKAPVTVLVHEATFLNDASERADNHLHSTASGAARTALKCDAKHLILTHFSARLRDVDEALSQAGEVLGQSCSLASANDGDRVRIDDDGEVAMLKLSESGWIQHKLSHH